MSECVIVRVYGCACASVLSDNTAVALSLRETCDNELKVLDD